MSLERRTSRSGRDSIDHPPNGHDDVANAVAGAIAYASSLRREACKLYFGGVSMGGPRPGPGKPPGYYGETFVGSDDPSDNTSRLVVAPALRGIEVGFVQDVGKHWDEFRERVLRNSN